MAGSQHTTRRALLGGATGQTAALVCVARPHSANAHVADLARQLTKRIAHYQRADNAAVRAFRKTYPEGRDAAIARLGSSEEEVLEGLMALEQRSGFEAACEQVDHAADEIVYLSDLIMAVPASLPGALALKARACLWEAPIEALNREGFGRAARFLSELTRGASF